MATNSKITKAELEAQIEELKAQLAAAKSASTAQPAPAAPVFTIPSTDVTIVYCSDSMGYASISNMELHFNQYGEEFILSRSQFDELVGKYRSWFNRGVLAVSSKNIDVAAAKGLPTEKEYNLSAKALNSIGTMSLTQLQKLWEDNPKQSQRDSIVSFVKRKFIEGDEAYKSRDKIDLLNRLTDGGFAREQDELSGRYKIRPTEM